MWVKKVKEAITFCTERFELKEAKEKYHKLFSNPCHSLIFYAQPLVVQKLPDQFCFDLLWIYSSGLMKTYWICLLFSVSYWQTRVWTLTSWIVFHHLLICLVNGIFHINQKVEYQPLLEQPCCSFLFVKPFKPQLVKFDLCWENGVGELNNLISIIF